jgi:hypothetical protein
MTTQDEVQLLKLATREAHAAIKDLKAVLKEARGVIEEVQQCANVEVAEILGDAVKAGIGAMNESVRLHIEDATNRVYARFDKLADTILGDGTKGKPSLQELAEARNVIERSKELGY